MGLGEIETSLLEGTNKILHGPGPKGKEQWPHRRWNQILAVLDGLLQRCGPTGTCHRDRALVAAVLGGTPWWEPSWKPTLTHHRTCRFQGWVTSGQKLSGWGTSPTHHKTIRLKFYWSLPTSFFHCQSIPSGSLQEPPSLIHQRADRRCKKSYNRTAARKKTTSQKVNQKEKAEDYVPGEGTR